MAKVGADRLSKVDYVEIIIEELEAEIGILESEMAECEDDIEVVKKKIATLRRTFLM